MGDLYCNEKQKCECGTYLNETCLSHDLSIYSEASQWTSSVMKILEAP